MVIPWGPLTAGRSDLSLVSARCRGVPELPDTKKQYKQKNGVKNFNFVSPKKFTLAPKNRIWSKPPGSHLRASRPFRFGLPVKDTGCPSAPKHCDPSWTHLYRLIGPSSKLVELVEPSLFLANKLLRIPMKFLTKNHLSVEMGSSKCLFPLLSFCEVTVHTEPWGSPGSLYEANVPNVHFNRLKRKSSCATRVIRASRMRTSK